ncbi:MAG: AmpG family muropeptide MFS transporter [Desulfopila sp.]
MDEENGGQRGWGKTLSSLAHPRAVAMLFLGFSAGIPILLIFSTLSVWLREAGVSRSAVTFFSWAALAYSFKFLWAPLVDLLPLPLLTRLLGRRRSWLLLAQSMIIAAICWMGFTDPLASSVSLTTMAMAAVMLGFSSATQDIVIDAYRIESAEKSMQAVLASMYIAGYRLGMLVAGAGSLYLASWLGTSREAYQFSAWRQTYCIMAAVMLVGVITTLLAPEPRRHRQDESRGYPLAKYLRLLLVFFCTALAFGLAFFAGGGLIEGWKSILVARLPLSGLALGFLLEAGRFLGSISVAGIVAWLLVRANICDRPMAYATYVMPIKDFFLRYRLQTALFMLLLIGSYRVSDIVLGVVSNVFYVDVGFSNNEIATITKTFGLLMTLAGGFLGGVLTVRYGVMRILFVGAVLSSATNLLFMTLAYAGADISLLTAVIAADNLSGGLASTAFVAFLSALTSTSFTAGQYAIFSSVMTLFPKLLGGYSGTMVSAFGYENFFLLTAGVGIPVLVLIWLLRQEIAGEKS